MTIQLCFSGLRPDPPTLRSRAVAEEIARRIVAEVNLDDFYWEKDELPDRIADVTEEIMGGGKVRTLFTRLHRKQPPYNDKGDLGGHPYGWEGIDEHCRHIADEIADGVLTRHRLDHLRQYGRAK